MSKWTDQLPEAAKEYIGSRRVDEVECVTGDIAGVARGKAMPATKFGRLAAHDPRFVLDLRMGRTPRRETELRTRAWMQGYADRAAAGTQEAA